LTRLPWGSPRSRHLNFAPGKPFGSNATAMLDNQTKLNIALARFAGFVAELPLSPNEEDVLQYHGIVQLLEEGYGENLSRFRVASDRLKPRPVYGWRSKEPAVEFGYFLGQVRALTDYLMIALGGRPC
jgi:hypothetical protein